MKKFFTSLLLLIVFLSFSGVVSSADNVTSIPQKVLSVPSGDGKTCKCAATGQIAACGEVVCPPPKKTGTLGGGTGEQGGNTSGGSGSKSHTTTTAIPDAISGGICEDLLNCKKINLGEINTLEPGIKNTYLYKEMIPYAIKLLLNLGGGLAVLMLVYAGYLFLTTAGNDEQRTKAIKTITFTIIGLLAMILARAIVAIVENLPLG